jgi:HSP20 family protein
MLKEVNMKDNTQVVNVETKENIQEILEKEAVLAPLVDIFENEDEFILVANMPGVTKENVHLKYEEDALMIFGKVNYQDLSHRKYILNENGVGNYYRRFRISDSIDESRIDAKFDNGQLFVTLPKHERVKPKSIQIK